MSYKLLSCGKFSQFMADHIFRYKHRNKLLTVMNSNSETNHLGSNGRSSPPRINHGFISRRKTTHFLKEFLVNVWTFFRTSSHVIFSYLFLKQSTYPTISFYFLSCAHLSLCPIASLDVWCPEAVFL